MGDGLEREASDHVRIIVCWRSAMAAASGLEHSIHSGIARTRPHTATDHLHEQILSVWSSGAFRFRTNVLAEDLC